MANLKIGLDYFAFDVDFFDNDKIEFLGARFGLRGENIAIRLLCRIYRGKGYYCSWGKDEALLFAKRAGDGCTAELAEQVVEELAERDFFDKTLFQRYGILTSREIQKRYLEAAAKRSRIELRAELLLISPENRHNIVIIDNSGESRNDSENISTSKEGEEKEESTPPSSSGNNRKKRNDNISQPTKESKQTDNRTADETEFLSLLTAKGTQSEAICRRFGLVPQEIEQWAIRFCDKLASEGCTRKNRTDLLRHFNNWLNMELYRSRKTPLHTSMGQTAQILSKFKDQ